MLSGNTERGGRIERWSPTLFRIGGWLLLGHAVLLGLQAGLELTPPPDVFGPAGHLLALGGLLGLYPALGDRAPRGFATAGVVAAVAGAGWLGWTVTRSLAIAGLAPDALPSALVGLTFLATILAYLAFGAVSLRVERRLGFLVLAPAVLLVAVLAVSAGTGAGDLVGFVAGAGLAGSMLAIGSTLRARVRATDHAAATGATAG